MKRFKPFKKADVIILCALLAVCAALFALRGGGNSITARIAVDGETLYEIRLSDVTQEYTLTLDNGVTVGVSPEGVRFVSSDCPGQDCVRCGLLRRAGQAAACVPNRTVILLEGRADKTAPDAISY